MLVAHLHDIESFWGVNQDTVQYIQHAGTLTGRPKPREEPVEAVTVGKLRAVGVVSFDHCSQELV